jgi:NitT/TauT family transport system substrate-binding protein
MTQIAQNRRLFLSMLSSAACMSLIGGSNVGAQDERLETTTIRIAKIAGICIAPQYVADALLRAEGFTISAMCKLMPEHRRSAPW